MADQRRRYEAEMRERFGDNWKAQQVQKAEAVKELKGVGLAENGIELVSKLYTEIRTPGVAQTCFKTCNTLLGNLLKDPANDKFRRVNLENNAIKTRVATINGGLKILMGGGFYKNDEGNALVIEQGEVDAKSLSTIIKML